MKKHIVILVAATAVLLGAGATAAVSPANAALDADIGSIEQSWEGGGGYSITPEQYCRLPGTQWTWIAYMAQWAYGWYHVYQCWGYGWAQYMYSYYHP